MLPCSFTAAAAATTPSINRAISCISKDKQEALRADSYQRAHKARERYMQETSVGIHSAVVDKTVTLV
jgi:hypothetical protein